MSWTIPIVALAILVTATAAAAVKPRLVVSDVSVNEAVGKARFKVNVSRRGSNDVRVRFATESDSAYADADFTARKGRLRIPAGARKRTVAVPVLNDLTDEFDESFGLALYKPKGARLGEDDRGVATIVDDDPITTVSISDAQVVEGDAGEVLADFVITRSGSGGPPSVDWWVTAEGTALPADYDSWAGRRVYFTPSQLSIHAVVPVYGDDVDEADETFAVRIGGVENAVIADDTGVGTIIDDD